MLPLPSCTLPVFRNRENELLVKFRNKCITLAAKYGAEHEIFNFYFIVDRLKIEINKYNKFVNNKLPDFFICLWIIFLEELAKHVPMYKYNTLEEFLGTYEEYKHLDSEEQHNLLHTANWMNILFHKIPVRGSKGIVMEVYKVNCVREIYFNFEFCHRLFQKW